MSMQLEYIILIAFLLDLWIGDPVWRYHPVCIIGFVANYLEHPFRRIFRSDYLAGILMVLVIVVCVGTFVWCVCRLERYALSGAPVLSILVLYYSIATRDLILHSRSVFKALATMSLIDARRVVSKMVGRDAQSLNKTGVIRAAIESVSENTVDGITAPLFYALLFGPVGAMVYKAINTLDSTFGYKNDRYIKFGWASAKLDDLANYLPARLTAFVMWLAAGILRLKFMDAIRVTWSDCRHHASPNSGFSQAAMAGALNIQLGGGNYYSGIFKPSPKIGKPNTPLNIQHIKQANQLVLVTAILFLLIGVFVRSKFVA